MKESERWSNLVFVSISVSCVCSPCDCLTEIRCVAVQADNASAMNGIIKCLIVVWFYWFDGAKVLLLRDMCKSSGEKVD